MSGFVLSPDSSLKGCDQGLNCAHCHSILREAVQTIGSGTRLCKACFKEIVSLRENERPRNILIKDENDCFQDRAAQRQIEDLIVQCERCPWKGKRREFENHECMEEGSLEITPASSAGGPCAEEDPIQAARSMFQEATAMAGEQQQLLQTVGQQQSQQQNTLGEMVQELPLVRANHPTMSVQQSPFPDGTLVWRVMIHDFGVRLQSPPFYTGRAGYKMCVRAIFRAGTVGNELRLSLYFTIMRGTFDCFLTWPFSSKVSFILVDPDYRKHIVRTIHPNPENRSYLRPVSEMNIAMGFPHFATVPESYIRDNSILIKCIVDTSNIIHL